MDKELSIYLKYAKIPIYVEVIFHWNQLADNQVTVK